MEKKTDLSPLYRHLDYRFKNSRYLEQALTHRSAGSINNERLEFLGDSILNFVIAHQLFKHFTEQSEGKLSRLRAFLVKGETLAEIALEIHLGDYLKLGQGELKSGGFRRASILSDSLEAIFAAVFLDGGLDAVERVILKLYRSRLHDPSLNESLKDAKTQLQEYLQAYKMALPVYELISVEGEEHNQVFYIKASVPELKKSATGQGSTRRKAEQEAARKLLQNVKT
ncbi:ribonuclease III [Legionella israelensis]|uniref:Ribonuclease 3 n=1 Tax=Legionella israelensis TaxID=454 RepID=A0AAX1EFS7_9GAMM|nr:ribonuclease III [Legionella israelensis]QBR83679.1 ribonuclease III [Legionella israelensis]